MAFDWSAIPRVRELRRIKAAPAAWFNGAPVRGIAIDPGGRTFLTSAHQGLRLYDATTGRLLRAFESAGIGGIRPTVGAVGFSTDGRRAFANRGGGLERPTSIGVWDTETGALVRELPGGGRIGAFDRSGTRALACNDESDVTLWDLAGGRVLRTLEPRPFGGIPSGVFLGPSGNRAVTVMEDDSVALWDFTTGAVIWRREVGPVVTFAAPADGSWFAVGSTRGRIALFDPAAGAPLATFGTPVDTMWGDSVHCLAVSATGRRLVAVNANRLAVWDVAARAELFHHNLDAYRGVATISADGSWVVAGDDGGGLWRFDLPEHGDVRISEPGDEPAIVELAFAPDGTPVASGPSGRPGEPRVATATPPAWLPRLAAAMASVRWDSAGPWGGIIGADLAVTIIDNQVFVFDLAQKPDGALCSFFAGAARETNFLTSVTTLALHPDSRRLAVGTTREDGIIELWDARAAVPIAALEGHGADITALAFSPDGTKLASASRDRTIRLWPVPPGQAA